MGQTVGAGSSMLSDSMRPLSCDVFMSSLSDLAADDVDHGQDDDPHPIDEMPIPGHQLHVFGVSGRSAPDQENTDSSVKMPTPIVT